MSIVRAKRPNSGFTIVDNNVIRDERLSWLARGILIGILSRPDNWRTSAVQIAKESPKERRDAVLSALRELKTVGYMIQHKLQDDRGRWSTVTYVFDVPQDVSAGQTECASTGSGPAESGSTGPIRSTNTKNQEEDVVSGGADPWTAQIPFMDRPRSDWRGEDRQLWEDTIGTRFMTCDGSGPWMRGSFTTAAVYDAFRKGNDRIKAKTWPGIFLSNMRDWEDYLSGLGVTPTHDERRQA